MTSFFSGLIFGVVGSAHCAVMCGPLVLTVGRALHGPTRAARLRHAAAYHGGRLSTYVLLGLVSGLVGQSLALAGLGRVLAVLAGAILLLAASGVLLPAPLRRWSAGPASLAVRACGAAVRIGRAHPVAGPAAAGAANGLLPCGLVYAAVLTATALGQTASAGLLMLGFGMGTLPALLVVSPLARRPALRHLTPVLLAITAILLLARGLVPTPLAGHDVHAGHAVSMSR